jgi:hypothetical protein
MDWFGVNGGLSRGGVGICRIGSGGALLDKGSVTPGIVGMSGGKLRDAPVPASMAVKRTLECIMNYGLKKELKRSREVLSRF